MDYSALIQCRKSVRAFRDTAISDNALNEIEDFYMIENVFNNEPDQLSKNDINYLFKLLNKFIKE